LASIIFPCSKVIFIYTASKGGLKKADLINTYNYKVTIFEQVFLKVLEKVAQIINFILKALQIKLKCFCEP